MIRKIFTFPDKILTEKSAPLDVRGKLEAGIQKLADDMLETMYEAPGIGLAAVQVGELSRIIVLDTEYESDDGPLGPILRHKDPKVLINPEIFFREGKTIFEEGCLSVPGYNADVERSLKIKVKYLDRDGLVKEMSADGLLSVCIQHELDHLEGKLFIEKLSALKREMAKKKLLRAREERDSRYGLTSSGELGAFSGKRKSGRKS